MAKVNVAGFTRFQDWVVAVTSSLDLDQAKKAKVVEYQESMKRLMLRVCFANSADILEETERLHLVFGPEQNAADVIWQLWRDRSDASFYGTDLDALVLKEKFIEALNSEEHKLKLCDNNGKVLQNGISKHELRSEDWSRLRVGLINGRKIWLGKNKEPVRKVQSSQILNSRGAGRKPKWKHVIEFWDEKLKIGQWELVCVNGGLPKVLDKPSGKELTNGDIEAVTHKFIESQLSDSGSELDRNERDKMFPSHSSLFSGKGVYFQFCRDKQLENADS